MLSVVNNPIPGQVVADDEAACPDANGVTKLDGLGARRSARRIDLDLGKWWDVKPIVIPASVFATSTAIVMPISVIARLEPPGNCGITAPAGEKLTCTVRAAWQGILTLHRTS